MITFTGKYTSANVTIDNVEEACVSQIISMTNHNAFTNPIVVMQDCHAGKGSVIGFTMKMGGKVVPNTIGVDISCGMLSFCIGDKINMSLEDLDKSIRRRVPFGYRVHNKPLVRYSDFSFDIEWLASLVGADIGRVVRSIGTLGGGK